MLVKVNFKRILVFGGSCFVGQTAGKGKKVHSKCAIFVSSKRHKEICLRWKPLGPYEVSFPMNVALIISLKGPVPGNTSLKYCKVYLFKIVALSLTLRGPYEEKYYCISDLRMRLQLKSSKCTRTTLNWCRIVSGTN